MAKSAAQMAANYQNAMMNPQAAANYKAGIQGVTQSPTAAAATPEAEARYIQGVQQSVSNGKRTASLQRVSLSDWQQAATNKGAARLSSGAQQAQSKVQAHFQKWAPIYAQAAAAAAALPKGGMANAMARVQASMQVLMAAAGKA